MRRGVALAGMAAVFAAMLGRAGLVDWVPIIEGVALVMAGCAFVAGILIVALAVPGLVVLAIWLVIKGLIGPDRAVSPSYSALSKKN